MNSSKGLYTEKQTIENSVDYITEKIKDIDLNNIVILCIGTDRSSGDSLGPFVGEMLKHSKIIKNNCTIYGNLESPVHAKNLCETIEEIHLNNPNAYIIAIDACLGSLQNVGKVIVEEKPLSPGAAMNKDLPKVGNLSITGVVNICGAFDFMVLQNTRLNTVYGLAKAISTIIKKSIKVKSCDIINEKAVV
jgi:putative sporulation protein YyaC